MANQPNTKRDRGGQKEQGSGGGKGNPAKNAPASLRTAAARRARTIRAATSDVSKICVAAQENPMKEQATDSHPLSDLAYDWITLIQNKAQALMAYDQYIKDAEQAGSPECAAFFRKVHDSDKAQLAEAKEHLVAVLQGKMGRG
jgi:hypothetical protein